MTIRVAYDTRKLHPVAASTFLLRRAHKDLAERVEDCSCVPEVTCYERDGRSEVVFAATHDRECRGERVSNFRGPEITYSAVDEI